MPRLVMKFGGTSVADLDRIRNAATKVKAEVDRGYEVAVIVSAMSGKTNELVGWVRDSASPPGSNGRGLYDAREYDAVVASGDGQATFSGEAAGVISFDKGGSVVFQGIEHLTW